MEVDMPKYDEKAQKSVALAVRRYKKGKLKSGKRRKKVTSRKQAIAIGLSEARAEGAKVPQQKTKKTVRKKTARKKTSKQPTRRKPTTRSKTAKKRTVKTQK